MKVINLIQNMQAAIDALSFHPADTEVSIKAGAFSTLTGNVAVDDSTGNVVMKFEQQVNKLDIGAPAGPESFTDYMNRSKGQGKPLDWSKIKIVDSIVTYGADKVTDTVNDALLKDDDDDHGKPIVTFDLETHEESLDWARMLRARLTGQYTFVDEDSEDGGAGGPKEKTIRENY